MASSILNSDDGVVSGTAGLKTSGGDDGTLKIQANGVDAISIANTGAVTMNTAVTLSGGALGVASGGTGATTLAANNVLLGNGTSALQTVAAGTAGNVLTSNGTTWTSAAAAAGGGDYIQRVYTSPATWTKPAGLKAVKVTVVSGGGAGGGSITPQNVGAGGGGSGAISINYFPQASIPSSVTVTVGTGGAGVSAGNGNPGGSSSFGALISATGGAGNTRVTTGAAGGSAVSNALGTFVGYKGGNGTLTPETTRGGAGGTLQQNGIDTAPLIASPSVKSSFLGFQSISGAGVAGGNGGDASGFGAGGGGASGSFSPSKRGGNGSPGLIVVEEFY
jgi:hypothetical protein